MGDRGTPWAIRLALLVCALAMALSAPAIAVAIDPGVAFYGTVLDAVTEAPIEAAGVEAWYEDEETWYGDWTATDASGAYQLSVPAGTYTMSAWADPQYEQATDFDVVFDGETAVQKDFYLEPGVLALWGSVTDAADAPIEGVEVGLWAEDDESMYEDWTYTGEDGGYELYSVPSGSYNVYAYKRAYLRERETGVVLDGENAIEKNFVMTSVPSAFFGTVTAADTEAPVGDAEVGAYYDDEESWYSDWMYTGEDGAYELFAPAGTYTMYVVADDYTPVSEPGVGFDGENAVQRDFVLDPLPLAFFGTVAETGSENPVADATVSAWYDDEDSWFEAWVQSGDDGSYEIFAPAGAYDVGAYKRAYLGDSASNVAFDGETAVQQDFSLQPLAVAFTGTVTDAVTTDPVPDAEVTCWFDDDESYFEDWTSTGEDGTYSLYGPAGTFELSAYASMYATGRASGVQFDGENVVTQDFALAPLARAFYGTVTDAVTSDAIEDAEVSAWYDDGVSWYEDWTSTDAEGYYELYAPQGTFNLYADAEYYRGIEEVDVAFDGTTALEKNFALESIPLAFYGTVKDSATEEPIVEAEVGAWYDDGESWYEDWVLTDETGQYQLRAEAGTYDMWVGAWRYMDTGESGVVFDGANAVQKDFSLDALPVAFFGTVTDAVTDEPVAEADITGWYEDETSYYDFWAMSQEDGSYELYAPAATYELEVEANGYRREVVADAVYDGGDAVQQDFQMHARRPLAADAYEADGSIEEAKPINVYGVTQYHSLFPEGDSDWMRFDASAGTTYTIETTEADWGTDTYLYLYDAEGVQIASNDDGGQGYFSWIEWKAESDGVAYVEVRHYDEEDGTGDYYISVQSSSPPVDSVAPQSEIVGSLGWTNADVSFTFSASDDSEGSGVAAIYYRIGAGEEQLYDGNPVTVSAEGVTGVTYRSVDFAGNEEAPQTAQVKIDKTKPTTTSNAAASYTGTANITLTPADIGGSGLKETWWKLGSGAWVKGTTCTVSAAGSYTLQFYSTDNAGNTGDTTTKTFTVSAPAVASFLTVAASPTALKSYDAATVISGTLRAGSATGAGIANQSVYVQIYTSGAWKTVKTLTTNSGGAVSWSTTPRSATKYRLSYPGKANAYLASATTAVKVMPKAYLSTPAASRYGTRAYTISSKMKPRHKAGTYPVRIYRWKKTASGSWKSYGYVKAKAYDYRSYTKVKVKHRFPSSGKWRIKAVAPADSGHLKSKSGYTYLTVR